MIRKIPLNALQKGVFSILTQHQTNTVYDAVPKNAVFPYVTLGEFTNKFSGSKNVDISDVSLQIHIWSKYEGKAEVNGIAEDLAAVLTSWPVDLSSAGFNVISQGVDFFEAFPEEIAGYHGVLTFVAKVQNLGG